jgi:pimeloyl-ACP methyl ester carboxylesterase
VTETPHWFAAAVAQRPEQLSFDHEGHRLHYRAWGGRGQPVVVLVHGGSAQGGWWEHIAPYLVAGHRVIAPDLSGHGQSDWREVYGLEHWAEEVRALGAAEAAGSGELPFVIGHSMGGWVALMAAALAPDAFAGMVVIDSPMQERSPEERAAAAARQRTTLPVYATRAEAMSHFRLTPGQESSLPYVMEHVAATSVTEREGGWTWWFDPQIWQRATERRPDLRAAACDVTLLACEKGLLTPQAAGRGAALMAGRVTVAQIPNAGHHVMMDEPLALVTALRLVLAAHDTP